MVYRPTNMTSLDHKIFSAFVTLLKTKASGEDGVRMLTAVRKDCVWVWQTSNAHH